VIAATSYPLLSVFWTILIFFGFIVWLWVVFAIFTDLFRRHDTSAFVKVLWMIFVIVLPYIGIFAYLIIEHDGMRERAVKQQDAANAQFSEYVRSVAPSSDPTEQIAKAKQMLDSGTITQAEFEQLKQKALAT
jgi:hypothetical protein